MAKIRFIVATFGDFPGLPDLLSDEEVQGKLLSFVRGEIDQSGLGESGERLRELELLYSDGLAFPVVLEEAFSKLRRDLERLSEEYAEIIYNTLADVVGGSEEAAAVAVLGELDAALDDSIVEVVRPLRLTRGEVMICGFEGAPELEYSGYCEGLPEGLSCIVEAGSPERYLRASIDSSSPIFSGSQLMRELSDELRDVSLDSARGWVERLRLAKRQEGQFVYGFTKLVFHAAVRELASRDFVPWNVRLEYEVRMRRGLSAPGK